MLLVSHLCPLDLPIKHPSSLLTARVASMYLKTLGLCPHMYRLTFQEMTMPSPLPSVVLNQ